MKFYCSKYSTFLKLNALVFFIISTAFSAGAQQTFSTYQAANLVIGQSNFNSSFGSCTQNNTYGPSYSAISSKGVLAICDQTGNRINIWKSPFIQNGQLPDIVVGKPDFSDCSAGVSATRIRNPNGVAFSPDGNKLIVSDLGNSRVLIWNTIPTSNGQAADVVLGQPNFNTTSSGTTASNLSGPTGIYVSSNGKLIVSEVYNNRVLIWNSIPTTNGKAADVVVGQPNFTTATSGNAANKMNYPWGVWISPEGKMLVAEYYNNRVLIFNSIPTTNGVNADLVVGQTGFGNSSSGTGPNKMNGPVGVTISPDGKMAIAEFTGHRVLIYNTIPTTNGANADVVLGQPNFNTSASFYPSGVPTNQNMRYLYNVSFDLYGRLFVVGRDMNRGMIFGNLPDKKAELGIKIEATSIAICAATPTTNVVTIVNNGPDAATNVVSTSSLPSSFSYISHNVTKGTYNPTSGYWNIPSIPSGDSVVLTINGNSTTSGTFTAYANIIQSNQLDLNLDNNGTSIIYTAVPGLNCVFTDSVSSLSLCAGNSMSVFYTKAGTFNAGNFFSAELSDATGSFLHPVALDSINSTSSGVITTTIPPNTSPGTNYRIRVRSSNPPVLGTDNGNNIIINNNDSILTATPPILSNNGRRLTASTSPKYNQYQWYRNNTIIPGITTNNYYASMAGSYQVSYLSNCGVSPKSNTINFLANSQPQTITFPPISEKTFIDQPLILAATSSSSLPVSYSIISGPGIISDDTLRYSGLGTIVVKASQEGDNVYDTAPPVIQSIVVSRALQTITFPVIRDTVYGTAPFVISATASSGLPIEYSVQSGNASLTGNILTITGVGTVVIRAFQPGNTNFYAATSDRSFCVLPVMPDPISGDTLACANTSKSYSVSNVPGATFTWSLPTGGTITSSGNTASVRWTTPGLHTISVKYNGNCGTSDSTRTLSVRVDTELSGTFANMLPANGNTSLMLPLTFSWSSINNALFYDLYIWPSNVSRPTTPTIANLTGSTYTINDSSFLQYETLYRWQVVAKRNCYTFLSPIQTFTLRYSPDIVVDSIGVPVTGFAGRPISISWKVKNTGRRITTTSTWIDRIYVSANPVFNPGSSLVQFNVVHNGNLLPGTLYTQTLDTLLPSNISGTYYIHVFTDAANQLPEYNQGGENNNVLISAPFTVLLKMPADLIVQQVTIPIKASAGQKANIKWTVKNQGDTTINVSNWSDKIYISTLPAFNINNAIPVAGFQHYGGLQANSEYSNSLLVTVPFVTAGNYYVYVITDTANNVAEYDENNNVRRSDAVVQIGIPDLMVSNVSIPGSVNANQTFKVTWYIRNRGAGATETASWTDRIFLSPIDTFTPNNAIWFDVKFAAQTLDANESVYREIDLRMPDIAASGRYYAYVYTDFTSAVYEDTSEYNNISRSPNFSNITTGLPVNDIGVSEIITPQPDCGLTANETIKVKISNYGNLSHTGFNVSYKLNNGAAVTENVGTANLLPGSTLIYTFNTKANLSGIADYAFKVYTSIPNDTLRSNDTTTSVIKHFPALSAPANLLPANGSLNLSKPVNFSWSAVPNSKNYDLFIWKSSDTEPAVPTVTNLTQINYSYYGNLLTYGTAYNWKVIARSNNCATSSAIQTFTIRHLPDLVVDSIILPLNGGTSESPFSVSWIVKNKGLGATNSGWYESVYITESQTDRSGDILVGNFQNLSALDPNSSYTHPLFTFPIPQGYQGRYYIVIKTNMYQYLEEATDTNNIKIIPIDIILAPPPDLQVDSLVVSPSTLFSEDTINVSWRVSNRGTGPTTTASWVDIVYLSTNDTLNAANSIVLGRFQRNGALIVNGQYLKNERFKLPPHIGGTYFIHVFTDANEHVYEYINNINNTAKFDSIRIIMRPNPNLVMPNVSLPVDTVSSNQTLSFQWTIKNEGAAPANPSWVDNIRLTGDTANGYANYFNLGNFYQNNILQSLSATGSQQNIQLPNELAEGKYFAYGITDIYNQVFEGAPEETDNVSPYSSPVYIVNPDLNPTSLNAPPAARSEETITVSWTAKNIGKGGVYNSSWSDAVYLSQNTTLDNNDVLLTTVGSNLLLLPDNEYTKQQTVTLPRGISGTYYLIVVADNGNSIFEKNETNNQRQVSMSITIAPWSDLQVTGVQLPATDTAGTNITFSYTAKNSGTAKIDNKLWRDVFYLSSTKNLADPNKIYFATSYNNQRSLDTSQSYTNSVTVQLPAYISGPYYIIAAADAGNDIYEYISENNNQRISDTTVAISQLPNVDLAAITGKVAADSLTPGQAVSVEWYGGNAGTTPTIITEWEDAIYLSNNQTLDAGDSLLKTVKINKLLQPATSYNQKTTVNIPNDASGKLYFLLNVDRTNQQNDANRSNNTRVLDIIVNDGGQVVDSGGGVVIVPPLPSDLVPVSFVSASTGTSGQPITLSYSVKNNGTGKTNSSSWTDRVYLSTDNVLDWNDIQIGSFSHIGQLNAGAQYADTQQVFIPSYISGNYVVIFKTDANDNVFELNAENNNIAFGNIFIQPQQPCDLIVSDVSPPSGLLIAGQNIAIDWTLKNIGSNPANGYFRDAVYLSKDTVWNISDLLLGTSDIYNSNIPQQASLNRQFTGKLTNVAAGNYYVIVRTDILNNLVEVNENNNNLSSVSPVQVDVKLLTMNAPAADTLVNNELLYYRINIPATQKGETMSLTLKGDTARHAVNRLYLKYAEAPAANAYDFVSEIPFAANQEIIVPELKEGTYYIMASGNDTATAYQPVTLLARIIPFAITKVDAGKGGNTGAVTVKINGAKFDSATSFQLTGVNGTITPVKIYYTNSTQVFATFNLLNANMGLYNVVATKSNNDSTRLVNGFEIEKGVGSTAGNNGTGPGSGTGFVCQVVNIGFEDHLETGYEYPPSTRPRRLVGITLHYINNSNVDIPIPTVVMSALKNNIPLSFSANDISQSLSGLGSALGGLLGNLLASLVLDITDSDGPPGAGILRPGASGYKKVYTGAHDVNIGSLDFMIYK